MITEHVKIGSVVELCRESIDLDPLNAYTLIGVYSWGKGLIYRHDVLGADAGTLKFFKLPADALLLSNIQAWEGAVAVTTVADTSCVASSRFLAYRAKEPGQVDVNYLRHYFLSDIGLQQIRRASPGTQARNRTLGIAAFEEIRIPLPCFSVQQKIAREIDTLDRHVRRIQSLQAQAHERGVLQMVPALLAVELGKIHEKCLLKELCTSVHDLIHPGEQRFGADIFVGLEHIEPHTGQRLGRRPLGDEKGRKLRFEPGDVLYGYLRPYLNKAWNSDLTGLCSVEQFVLRPTAGVSSSLLSSLLRSSVVYDPVIAATNNLQLPRVSAKTLLNLEVPDIRFGSEIIDASCRSISKQINQAAHLRTISRSISSALVSNYRNRVFHAPI